MDLQKALGPNKSIMLLPVGMSDDGAHGPAEKLNRDNYIKGSKLLGSYWYYFAEYLSKESNESTRNIKLER